MELKRFFIEPDGKSGWWLWARLIRSDKMSKKRSIVRQVFSRYTTDILLMLHHHHRPSSSSSLSSWNEKSERQNRKLFCIFMLSTIFITLGQEPSTRTKTTSYFMLVFHIIFVHHIVECDAVFLDIFAVARFKCYASQRWSKLFNQTRNSCARDPLHTFNVDVPCGRCRAEPQRRPRQMCK